MGKWISTTCCACLASNADFKSKGFKMASASLDHHFGGHLGMNGTEIVISARFSKGEGELFIGIQDLRFKSLVIADHRVRNIVVVRPTDRSSDGHVYAAGRKSEIVDLDRDSRCGL